MVSDRIGNSEIENNLHILEFRIIFSRLHIQTRIKMR